MSPARQRVALYARVSTTTGQQDPEMQLRELREYAKNRDFVIVGEYVDRMSGSKDSRPGLNRMMADAAQRKFDAVLAQNPQFHLARRSCKECDRPLMLPRSLPSANRQLNDGQVQDGPTTGRL